MWGDSGLENLTLTGGMFCVGFINLIGVVAGVQIQRLALFFGTTQEGSF
jgi:hypothetical protein